MLEELAAAGAKLALLTKGDREVQEVRLADSGLAPLFDVIFVVEAKWAEVVRSVVTALGLTPADVVSVGNSVRSDVLPSVEAGLRTVWIPAHVWEYERAHDHLLPDDVAAISDLDELLALIEPVRAAPVR